jgi:hypothetical protein
MSQGAHSNTRIAAGAGLRKPLIAMRLRSDGVPTWLYSDADGDGVSSAVESMKVLRRGADSRAGGRAPPLA